METIQLKLDDTFIEFVSGYLDGELDAIEEQVFKEYLNQSDAHLVFVQKAEKAKRALNNLPDIKAGADFEEMLARKIALERVKMLVDKEKEKKKKVEYVVEH